MLINKNGKLKFSRGSKLQCLVQFKNGLVSMLLVYNISVMDLIIVRINNMKTVKKNDLQKYQPLNQGSAFSVNLLILVIIIG